jgi:hypothetical protein
MKISKLKSFKIYLIAGLFLTLQLSFATDPVQVPIPPDNSPPPGPVKPLSLIEFTASATISDTELAVYFEWSVGDATITVYDSDNNVVYQETVDTDTTSEVYIPVDIWLTGDYRITVTYNSFTQRGYFSLE